MDISGGQITPENKDIEADNLVFSYDKRKMIDGISLSIPEKTITAIVRPSGDGKTTLVNLLSRFQDVDERRGTLGGHDVKAYERLMQNFSFGFQNVFFVPRYHCQQNPFLSARSPMEAVIEATRKAHCHDFMMPLPEGYDTVIGDGSVMQYIYGFLGTVAETLVQNNPAQFAFLPDRRLVHASHGLIYVGRKAESTRTGDITVTPATPGGYRLFAGISTKSVYCDHVC